MTAPASTALTVIERIEQSQAVLQLDARAAALVELLPDEAAALRFRRVVIQALGKNPDLLQCTPDSVVGAVFEAAAMGLEPTGAAGGAHLVPYNVNIGTKQNPHYEKRAQLIPDYRGIIRLVTKPGSDVISMEARVVKEGDLFEYQLGSDAWVKHTPSLAAGRSGKATTHVYSIARLRAGGPPLVDVEDRAGIERIQKRGKGSSTFSPWDSDWDEMGKKSLIKRHAKVLPVRPEVRSILIREDELDAPEPTHSESSGSSRAARLGSRLRAQKEITSTAGDATAGAGSGAPTSVPAGGGTASDGQGAVETAAPQSASASTENVAGAEAGAEEHDPDERPRMTRDELLARLEEARISFDYAVERSKSLWPDRGPGVQLSEYQVHELWIDLSKEAAAAAL